MRGRKQEENKENYIFKPPRLLQNKIADGIGLMTKSWTTKKGKFREGKRFHKGKVHKILTNPLYIGKLTIKDETYDGEHAPIIEKKKKVEKGQPHNHSILDTKTIAVYLDTIMIPIK